MLSHWIPCLRVRLRGLKRANGALAAALPLLPDQSVSTLMTCCSSLPDVPPPGPRGVHRLLLLRKHKHSCVAINWGVTPDLRPGPLSKAAGGVPDRWQRQRPRIPPPSPRLPSASLLLRAPASHRPVLMRRRLQPRSQTDAGSTPACSSAPPTGTSGKPVGLITPLLLAAVLLLKD